MLSKLLLVLLPLVVTATAAEEPTEAQLVTTAEVERIRALGPIFDEAYEQAVARYGAMGSGLVAKQDGMCSLLEFVDGFLIFALVLIISFASDDSARVTVVGDSNAYDWSNATVCGDTCSSSIALSQNFAVPGLSCNLLSKIAANPEQYFGDMSAVSNPFGTDWVVVHCGQGDMELGYCTATGTFFNSASAAFDRFKAFVQSVRTLTPDVRILFPGGAYGASPIRTRFEQYEALIAEYAQQLAIAGGTQAAEPPLVYIDVMGAFEAADDGEELYTYTETSASMFTMEGYGYWTEWIQTALNATEDNGDCVVWRGGVCQVHSRDIDVPTTSAAASIVGAGAAFVLSLVLAVLA